MQKELQFKCTHCRNPIPKVFPVPVQGLIKPEICDICGFSMEPAENREDIEIGDSVRHELFTKWSGVVIDKHGNELVIRTSANSWTTATSNKCRLIRKGPNHGSGIRAVRKTSKASKDS